MTEAGERLYRMQILRAKTPDEVLISMYAIREMGSCLTPRAAGHGPYQSWEATWLGRDWLECDSVGPNMRHRLMDELMCRVLKSIGFAGAVEIFNNEPKWYS